ncbi:unnamed protein product, partial [Urochloa humidicola]
AVDPFELGFDQGYEAQDPQQQDFVPQQHFEEDGAHQAHAPQEYLPLPATTCSRARPGFRLPGCLPGLEEALR